MYNVHSLTLHNKETHKKMNCLQILNSSYMPFPLLFPIYINLTSKPNTISSVYEIIMHTLYVVTKMPQFHLNLLTIVTQLGTNKSCLFNIDNDYEKTSNLASIHVYYEQWMPFINMIPNYKINNKSEINVWGVTIYCSYIV